MGLIVAGLVINLLVCFGVLGKTEGAGAIPIEFFYGALFFWVLSIIGLAVAVAGKRKPGAILVFIGSIVFVPIGLIAVIGARKLLDKNAEIDLETRRQAAAQSSTPPGDGAA